jgi:hypothetical protein
MAKSAGKPAPIPRVVELACKWLEYEHRPLTPAERAARWRDNSRWPLVDHVIDDRREALYEPDRGLRAHWSIQMCCCAVSNRRTPTIAMRSIPSPG